MRPHPHQESLVVHDFDIQVLVEEFEEQLQVVQYTLVARRLPPLQYLDVEHFLLDDVDGTVIVNDGVNDVLH